jgi:predicted  nucleic acid-binding Zn-ribbon protein
MANKTNEISVEEKLRALYDLQIIDSRLDEIRNTRGELPIEVEDLEVEVEGLNKRASKFENEIKDLQMKFLAKKKQLLILNL